jgi:hypothetical protein
MKTLVYLISPSVENGRQLRFDLIKSDIFCELFQNADEAILNVIFNVPHVVLVDSILGNAEIERIASLLTKDHFHKGFQVISVNLSSHADEDNESLMAVQQRIIGTGQSRKAA